MAKPVKKKTATALDVAQPDLTLTDDETAQIKALDSNLTRARLAIADADAQAQAANDGLVAARAAATTAADAMRQRVLALITDRGGVLDGSQKWRFDSVNMVLARD